MPIHSYNTDSIDKKISCLKKLRHGTVNFSFSVSKAIVVTIRQEHSRMVNFITHLFATSIQLIPPLSCPTPATSHPYPRHLLLPRTTHLTTTTFFPPATQGALEEVTEMLAEVVARPHLRKPRSEIIRLTREAREKRVRLIREVKAGLP